MTPSADVLAREDRAARQRALDVGRSFLVQAPAGSGKTELLIQRFLALLATVDRPERIVALTFTRKAASEMRERVIGALRDAANSTPVDSAHLQQTRDLALAAIAQNERHAWQLIEHPSRLQVQTIDALCLAIARQAPLTTRLGANPRCEEQAGWLYSQAAHEALLAAPPDDPAWRALLAHVDNDASGAVDLLGKMLARRDQWLPKLQDGDADALRAVLETALIGEIEGELAAVRSAFPRHLASALVDLERYAAAALAQSPESVALAQALLVAANAGGLPPPAVAHLETWRTFAGWLLVKSNAAFRKSVSAAIGFAAAGGAAHPRRYNNGMKDVLLELAAEPGLASAVDSVRRLPPARYSDETWAIASALLAVLPKAAAHLLVMFRTTGAIDFVESTLAALDALGAPDAPTDLLLRLDFRIAHLLLDEFQDTSFTQLELIRRLTAGWQPDDGRTLFAVGDPMQSVYRFREAEVRLFVEAQQQQCIGDIPVECLTLRRNFRAQAGLVDWVNAVFPQVLGARSDPWRGMVAFAEAMPHHPASNVPAASLEVFDDARAEAQAVIGHIRSALAAGTTSIAVLVRARLHLEDLLPALRAAEIPFTAVELDLLGQRQAMRDLLSLTHALIQPADSLAWLSVLRAPWCGLVLPDLFAVNAAAPQAGSALISAALHSPETISGLSDDGRARLVRAARPLVAALDSRGKASVSTRVRGAWLALGGPACIADAIDLDAAERFFALLAEHETAGDIADWNAFVAALSELYAEPDAQAAGVQVMTLHRAKGLEFDTVIISGLARSTPRGQTDLLRWRLRPNGLLLAPMTARGGDEDPIYDYLGCVAADEEDAELGRLLYVGCTRARHRLHLTAMIEQVDVGNGVREWKPPPSGTALDKLWPSLGNAIPAPRSDANVVDAAAISPVLLSRLPLDWVPVPVRRDLPLPPAVDAIDADAALRFDWARETARHVGTVAHRLFAQIAIDGPTAWSAARLASIGLRIRSELRNEGVEQAGLNAAGGEVEAALQRLVSDERGRWLYASRHEDPRSEWALAGIDGESVVHIVIDRSFVADGIRWIIDFKTGRHEGGDLDAFLDRERTRYSPQLERYARIVRALDARPIRLGLYYPLQGGWREWAYGG